MSKFLARSGSSLCPTAESLCIRRYSQRPPASNTVLAPVMSPLPTAIHSTRATCTLPSHLLALLLGL